jgi:Domain of unknown function DUF29
VAESLHDRDYLLWTEQTAAALREGRLEQLDLQQIAEEIEDLGRTELRQLENRIAVLLSHLLKWKYQPAHRSASWRATIREQRRRITRLMREAPSLRSRIEIAEEYPIARDRAIAETGWEGFPVSSPFSLDEVLAESFWPE